MAGQESTVENHDFPESSVFSSFQVKNNVLFSRENTRSGQLKRKYRPHYRVINRYVKSKKQYWKERNRRKQASKLSSKGYTYKQIADRLGVSTKTVQRDLKKVRRYYTGQLNKAIYTVQAERNRRYQAELEGLTLLQQYRLISKRLVEYQKRKRGREYQRHLMKVIIDMDDLLYDVFPKIKHWPNVKDMSLVKPFHIQFIIRANGQNMKYGGFRIG